MFVCGRPLIPRRPRPSSVEFGKPREVDDALLRVGLRYPYRVVVFDIVLEVLYKLKLIKSVLIDREKRSFAEKTKFRSDRIKLVRV